MKMGAAPFNIPVIAEFTHPCANGNSVSGTATHTIDRKRILGRSSRWIGTLALGKHQSAPAPSSTRSQVINPGWKDSSPMAMNRNDAPQIPLAARNRAQWSPAKASRCVPCEVDRIRAPIEG